jgi:hypothetical protein
MQRLDAAKNSPEFQINEFLTPEGGDALTVAAVQHV